MIMVGRATTEPKDGVEPTTTPRLGQTTEQSSLLQVAAPVPQMPLTLTVPANGLTANHRSLDVAATIAAQLDIPIRVCSLVDGSPQVPARQRMLRYLTDSIPVDLTVTTTIDHGSDPTAFILDRVTDHNTLVVLSGGSTGLGLPGSITHEVLRFASAPVMFAGPLCLHWAGPVQRILVPVDGSRLAERCFPIAASWAQATSSPVEFVTVIDPSVARTAPIVQHDVVESGFLASVAHEFHAQYGIVTSFDVLHARLSRRAEAISDNAGDRPGTVVCLSSNGSAHNPHALATTTTRVVHLSPVPVIVVRS